MSDDIPLVSVILPTYNRAKYLPESIGSILNQTYPNIELIIIDDGSTDGTEAILQSYASNSKVRVYKNRINRERAYSRNKAIELSRGSFIALQESDDISASDRIARSVSATFFNEKTVGIFGGRLQHIDESGNPLPGGWHPPAGYQSGPVCRKLMLQGITVVATPTLMFRREVFDDYRFNTEYIPAEDWQLLLLATRDWGISNILGRPLVSYRNHPAQSDQTIQQVNKRRALQEEIEYENSVHNTVERKGRQ